MNFGTRAVEFCDLFEEYRWLSVKASYLAAYSTATTNAVTSIVGLSASEALSSVPTTAIQIAQYDTAHVTFLNQTTPIQINLARELLRGHQEWYSANVGADVPAVFSAAGMSISTGLAVAGNITILWEAKIQFKGNSDPAVTLYRKARRSVDPTHDIDKIVTSNLSKRFGVIAVE